MWIALATFIVGFLFGHENHRLRNEILQIKASLLEKKEVSPTTVSGNPELIPYQGDESSIVIPKSPQLIDFEENQELEKLNRTGAPR